MNLKEKNNNNTQQRICAMALVGISNLGIRKTRFGKATSHIHERCVSPY